MFFILTFSLERKGKTLFLLKEKAKPVAENKKRRKIDLFSMPKATNTQVFDQKQAQVDAEMSDS